MLAHPHPRQDDRLESLRAYGILDTPQEKEFDDIVALVAAICEVPVAVINFIDRDRQWFKAEVGLGVRSTPLETSLCSHVILEHDFVEIPDTLADPRMCDNPLCTADQGFRFYAGALLVGREGLPLGTLCVLDTRPRILTDVQRETLRVVAARVMSELDLRLALREQDVLRREIDHRVKNSLASVAAIVELQKMRSPSTEVQSALNQVLARLGALEALHEELHQEGTDRLVSLQRLVDRAVAKLSPLLRDNIAFDVTIDPVEIASDEANAVALVINEFATNSAKHAFGSDEGGTITIIGGPSGRSFKLMCSDDGSGDDAAVGRIGASRGLGARVIETLARSIGAQARWSSNGNGIRLEIDKG
ncbi:GAF domain-containing protein [Sphingomonas sinipercae]|uniref:GAF domain-containing protein n=1 Tax=Sphingomonas sinipercae TaxID=2714944 RepID=A0A6G7ZPA4_9SPHN|nr:histidine kinase dimerization/phosphoacceptor domain -containing protein [Sphingomonas sinipercae]QIL02749.1 GAF domain-containing protein [Sphingomonas sinipercae]